jgi:hypothetical protein
MPVEATTLLRVNALLAFGAALVSLRLSGGLAKRARERRAPELAAWAASLAAYALAAAALAWGEAHGWDGRAFRAYYLCGGLLTAPLLGVGSLAYAGRRWAPAAGLAYTGLAVGIALAVPLHGAFGASVPKAQAHLDFVPARLVAVLGNSLGTLAVVAVALVTIRTRPVGNVLILAGVAVAAAGSALGGLGAGGLAVSIAVAAALLFLGITSWSPTFRAIRSLTPPRHRLE